MEEHNKDAKSRMGAAVKKFASELGRVRTGRASLSIFDDVKAEYYGTPTPISQMAGLANPEPNLITVQPYDASVLGDIEKAILAANLGLTPSNDGSIIRITVPQLTEERRKEYVKQAHKIGENAKNTIRGIRRDINDNLKKLEKSKEISQDQMHTSMDEIQKITDAEVAKVDKLVKEKESEILDF
jgi:ribosome recycling factor